MRALVRRRLCAIYENNVHFHSTHVHFKRKKAQMVFFIEKHFSFYFFFSGFFLFFFCALCTAFFPFSFCFQQINKFIYFRFYLNREIEKEILFLVVWMLCFSTSTITLLVAAIIVVRMSLKYDVRLHIFAFGPVLTMRPFL